MSHSVFLPLQLTLSNAFRGTPVESSDVTVGLKINNRQLSTETPFYAACLTVIRIKQ